MRLAWIALAVASSAAADPLEMASPACGRTREVASHPHLALGARLFATASGFDVFWQGSHADDSGADLYLGSKQIVASMVEDVAAGPAGTYAITYPDNHAVRGHWQYDLHVALYAGAGLAWNVVLPDRKEGYDHVHAAWDGSARQWVIVGEERDVLPDASGYTHRLFVARLDARGRWIEKPTAISAPAVDAHVSDWGTPIASARDRVAVVWVGGQRRVPPGPENELAAATLFVTELARGKPTTITVATAPHTFFRTAIAATASGYVVAGAELEHLRDSRVFATTIEHGTAAPLAYVSASGMYGGEVQLASDGTRVALAWSEQGGGGNPGTPLRVAVLAAGRWRTIYAPAAVPGLAQPPQGIAWGRDGLALLDWKSDRIDLVELCAGGR
jgi:hypothetical protein